MNKSMFAVFVIGLASLINAEQWTTCPNYAEIVPLKISVTGRNTREPYLAYSQYARNLYNPDLREAIFDVVKILKEKLQSYANTARTIDNRINTVVADRQEAVPSSYIQALNQCRSSAQNVLNGLIDVIEGFENQYRDQLLVPSNCKCDDVEPTVSCTESATQALLTGVTYAISTMNQNDKVAAAASVAAFACVQGVDDNYDNYSF